MRYHSPTHSSQNLDADLVTRVMVGSGSLDDIEVTDEEREVMRECVREAFWFRSLPASIITGTC